jgi:hypothetical protein
MSIDTHYIKIAVYIGLVPIFLWGGSMVIDSTKKSFQEYVKSQNPALIINE